MTTARCGSRTPNLMGGKCREQGASRQIPRGTDRELPSIQFSAAMTEWFWAYVALGVFVGFFSGLLGVGGGSAMVPVLAFVFAAKGFDDAVHLALGTAITTMLFTSVASVRSHHLHRAVNWPTLRTMAPGLL